MPPCTPIKLVHSIIYGNHEGGGVESVIINNEWKERHKCLILMLNLKVSKQL